MAENKKSAMTEERVTALEGIGFVWDGPGAAWAERLSVLATSRRIHGHYNIPQNYSENIRLGTWVATQRTEYRLHVKGKKSLMTAFRVQELESLGFERDSQSDAWQDRLSLLADYRKMHGHCSWVSNQRQQYKLHLDGKASPMTTFRIKELESLGFERNVNGAAWKDHLSELADYRKIHGHCNVPRNYSENAKLAAWVAKQRKQYKFHLEGEKSRMTLSRIQ
jgi:hypothetical protein